MLQSSGPISLSQLALEFNDSTPNSLNEFYRGGALVPSMPANNNIPLINNPISLGNFYNSTKLIEYYSSSFGFNTSELLIPAGTWAILVRLTGGGGGAGGRDDDKIGGSGGYGMSGLIRFISSSPTQSRLKLYTASGGLPGAGASGGYNTNNRGLTPALTKFGGAFDSVLVAGDGGSPGSSGTSGAGGGGGGVSCLGWLHNSSLSDSNEILLAAAGGGGGGGGAGNYSITSASDVTNANINSYSPNRFTTTSISTFTTLAAAPDSWTSAGQPYRRAGHNSNGQGHYTMRHFYPPGDEAFYSARDGGGGGGGGGGNGHGGNLTRSANNDRIWQFTCDKNNTNCQWYAPVDFAGGGGGQGFFYYRGGNSPEYFISNTSFTYSTVGGYSQGWGTGGTRSLNSPGQGGGGAGLIKVTNNTADYTYPT